MTIAASAMGAREDPASAIEDTSALMPLTEAETWAVSGGSGSAGNIVVDWGIGKLLDYAFEFVVEHLNPESEATKTAAQDPYNPTVRANPFSSGR